jgi:hypothetical protein
MCETLPVPCMPAALAVMPGAHTLAVFEDPRKSKCNPVVRMFAPSGQGAGRHLAEIQSLLKPTPSDSATYDVREWRMAANAPVVVALDAAGTMVVFRAGRAPQRVCAHLRPTRLVAIDRLGLRAVVQARDDMVVVPITPDTGLHSPTLFQVKGASACNTLTSNTGEVYTVVVKEGILAVYHEKKALKVRLTVPVGTGIPFEVHLCGSGALPSVWVLYGAIVQKGARVVAQKWCCDPQNGTLKILQTLHFQEPFSTFSTLPSTGQLACMWPSRGGFVIQAGGNLEPLTSLVCPVGTHECTAWVPADMPRTIHISRGAPQAPIGP